MRVTPSASKVGPQPTFAGGDSSSGINDSGWWQRNKVHHVFARSG